MLAEEGVVVHGDLDVGRVRDGLPDGQQVGGEGGSPGSLSLAPLAVHHQAPRALDHLDARHIKVDPGVSEEL